MRASLHPSASLPVTSCYSDYSNLRKILDHRSCGIHFFLFSLFKDLLVCVCVCFGRKENVRIFMSGEHDLVPSSATASLPKHSAGSSNMYVIYAFSTSGCEFYG